MLSDVRKKAMLRHLPVLLKATRGCVTGCGLLLAAVLATVHAQPLDVSDEAFLLAQNAPNTVPPDPKMDPATLDVLLGQIDSFGFHLRNDPGGGMVSVTVYPVVLFRNGDALQDIARLDPAHVDASTRHGAAWTRWRRANGKLEIEGKEGWEALAFRKTYSTLPSDMRLDGRYRPVSGRGTAGSPDSAPAWSAYRFFADGRVTREQGAGSSAETQDAPAAAGDVTERHGRYRIDGLTLHIVYDDGHEERSFFVTDPALPNSTIWIDGVGHARRKR